MLKIIKNGVEFLPANEGIDHINAYSKSKTELGRWLSNFTTSPVEVPRGSFESLEAFYHYLKIARSYEIADVEMPEDVVGYMDAIKRTSGGHAQILGRNLKQLVRQHGIRTIEEPDDVFQAEFTDAMLSKFISNPIMLDLLKDTTEGGLEILHYYVVGNNEVIYKPHYDWLVGRIYEALELSY